MSKLAPDSCQPVPVAELRDVIKDDLHKIENGHHLEEWMEQPFNIEELNTILSLKNNSAPGLDQIDHRIIKAFPDNIKEIILLLFNRVIEEGIVPNYWLQTYMTFIPKANSRSLRPISCSHVLGNYSRNAFTIVYFGLQSLLLCYPIIRMDFGPLDLRFPILLFSITEFLKTSAVTKIR